MCDVFKEMNSRIGVLLDRYHQIGHSYFMEATSRDKLHAVLYGKIFPLLQEYFYDDQRKLKLLLGSFKPEAGRAVLSTQVLQEFYVNVTRKLASPLPEAVAEERARDTSAIGLDARA